jgi:hypothetical protein
MHDAPGERRGDEMSFEVSRREGPRVMRNRERGPWPERAYDNELILCFEKPGRVLVDRIAREERRAAPPDAIRDDVAIDDPFGC